MMESGEEMIKQCDREHKWAMQEL